ncbi:MAG TPA: SHOCT domain-containing protein [bacterium]|nr:SHOCT domain-containing protein [bacterium]
MSLISELKVLRSRKEEGLITQKEYENLKSRLLRKYHHF